ncbi:MAG: hypothetical protein ACRDIB_02275 [Ardenticatenaceae bacterium]
MLPSENEGRGQTRSETTSPNGSLSRRAFLKTVGAVALGSLAGSLPITPHLALASGAAKGLPPGDPRSIVLLSPLFHQILAELALLRFSFSLDPTDFQRLSDYAQYTALRLAQVVSPGRGKGVDVVSTVDRAEGQLAAVQYIIGWSLDCCLEVRSTLVDGRRAPIKIGTARGEELCYRPRRETHQSFGRDRAGIPPPPAALPSEGWPTEPAGERWLYGGCCQTRWDSSEGLVVHRAVQVVEERSGPLPATRAHDLL